MKIYLVMEMGDDDPRRGKTEVFAVCESREMANFVANKQNLASNEHFYYYVDEKEVIVGTP